MDPLSSLSQLIRQLAARSQGASKSGPAKTTSPDAHTAQPLQVRAAVSLRDRLRSRLRSAGGASPARQREIFVQTVLMQEFGEDLLADPAFSRVADQITDHLGSQPELSSRLAALLTELQNSGQT